MSTEKKALIQMQRMGFPPVKLLRRMAAEQTVQGLIFPKSMADNQQFLQKIEGRFRKDTSKAEESWDPGMREWQPLFYLSSDMLELSVPDASGCKYAYVFYDGKCSKFRMVYPVRSYGWTVGVLKTDGAKEMAERAHQR